MKNAFKWIGRIIVVLLIVALCGIGYILAFLPNVGDPQEMKITTTTERIEHGRYLANSVAVCMDCHSKRDWTKFSGPITPGTLGQGGEIFDQKLGFPGVYYSRNITPYNLGKWTDGEIFRAVTTGVNKAGNALFPLMPYHYYGQVDPEDIQDIIAYIRTLPNIDKDIPVSKSDFPFSIIINTIPHVAMPGKRPDAANTVEYGKYLVTMAGCVECHTKVDDKAQLIAGTEFGGGRAFELPWGVQRTPNITPHTTGIGAWSREQFVSRFKMYADSSYISPVLDSTDYNTIMPWTMYAQMTEEDLSAIYAYLKTVKPIDHVVERLSPAKKLAHR